MVAGTTPPITHRPSTINTPRRQRPHLLIEGGAFIVLRTVGSVEPDEPVQQSARAGDHTLVDDGDQRD